LRQRPFLEALEERWLLSTFTVMNTADSGTGTLRAAILAVNAGSDSEIAFNIPKSDPGYNASTGTWTISLGSALPTITANNVFLNGLSQGGKGNTTPLVELNGSSAGSSSDGLLLDGSGGKVSGLLTENFGANGIEVAANNNTIGGKTAGAGNILSSNAKDGILIDTGVSGVQVQGNYIGTDAANDLLGNSNGVEVKGSNNTIGGPTSAARNIISANNNDGLLFDTSASGNLVQGNYIGLKVSGSDFLGNSVNGVEIIGNNNTVGGTAAGAGNVISGNGVSGAGGAGLLLDSGSSGTVVQGNLIGTNAAGTAGVGSDTNGAYGVNAFGVDNTIGGTTKGARNVISGNAYGVFFEPHSTGNVVLGNYIGTNAAGNSPVSNGFGIRVFDSNNTIGGAEAGAGNVISGNSVAEIDIIGLISNLVVQGNYIGTDATGSSAVKDSNYGVEVGSPNITIGGTTVGARNIISGNFTVGVILYDSNDVVQNNYIGTDVTGTKAIGNGYGVVVLGANDTVGGTSAAARNIISGNANDGVFVEASGALVEGDYIGTNRSGASAVGNSIGVEIDGTKNTIGGTVAADRNVISGNSTDGVLIDGAASLNAVEGNYIGVNAAKTAAQANGSYGVSIAGSKNTIGAANTIADNAAGGVLVSAGNGDSIRRNAIFANGGTQTGPGIVVDSGANNDVVAPVLTSALLGGTTLTVQGTFTTPKANVSYVLEFFVSPQGDAEGKIYLGRLVVKPTSTGTQSFTFTVTTTAATSTTLITATLTDSLGDTSAFSNGVTS
jgi:titin